MVVRREVWLFKGLNEWRPKRAAQGDERNKAREEETCSVFELDREHSCNLVHPRHFFRKKEFPFKIILSVNILFSDAKN